MPFTTPGTATAGDVLTAAFWNSNVRDNLNFLPRGVLGTASSTSIFTTSATHTTPQDITNLSTSVTYGANRYFRLTLKVAPYASGGLQPVGFRIVRGSTPTVLSAWFIVGESLSTASGSVVSLSVVVAGPASGATETFKAQIFAGTSNSAVSTYADATYAASLTIEDVGSTV